ncbi:uncharacterized protein LOC114040207 [Vombatus ursinus]|uniref:uncharacterized protein LOC114040207 n=1 Tax=Vombatus ursinus TaxID=29139 RepID=UPI000FFD7874|nr:uncharacterized protein LOC114040207 [Vombatus ursinus]
MSAVTPGSSDGRPSMYPSGHLRSPLQLSPESSMDDLRTMCPHPNILLTLPQMSSAPPGIRRCLIWTTSGQPLQGLPYGYLQGHPLPPPPPNIGPHETFTAESPNVPHRHPWSPQSHPTTPLLPPDASPRDTPAPAQYHRICKFRSGCKSHLAQKCTRAGMSWACGANKCSSSFLSPPPMVRKFFLTQRGNVHPVNSYSAAWGQVV